MWSTNDGFFATVVPPKGGKFQFWEPYGTIIGNRFQYGAALRDLNPPGIAKVIENEDEATVPPLSAKPSPPVATSTPVVPVAPSAVSANPAAPKQPFNKGQQAIAERKAEAARKAHGQDQ